MLAARVFDTAVKAEMVIRDRLHYFFLASFAFVASVLPVLMPPESPRPQTVSKPEVKAYKLL